MYIVIWQIRLHYSLVSESTSSSFSFTIPILRPLPNPMLPTHHTQLSTLCPLTITPKPPIFFFSELIFEWGLGMESIRCCIWESCTKEDNLRKKQLGKRKLGMKPISLGMKPSEGWEDLSFLSCSPQVLRQKNPPFRKPLVSLLPLWIMIKFPFLIFITVFSGPKTNQRFVINVQHQKDLDPNASSITTSHWSGVSQPPSLPEISLSTHWV